jgi:cardiolipin synthase
LVWIITILLLFIIQIITVLLVEFRHPAKTVAWLVILFMVPFLGFVMYYFMAKSYSHKRRLKSEGIRLMKEVRLDLLNRSGKQWDLQAEPMQRLLTNQRLYAFLHHLPGSPICKFNQVTVLSDTTDTFKALKEAIEEAKDHIHFQFYTIRNDQIGHEFQQLFIRKAREGVNVRVMYDGVGSYKLSKQYIKELQEAGVEVQSFLSPLFAFLNKRLNYRNHRKIVVIDGVTGFFGGVNIGDEYLGEEPRLGFWRDTHLRVDGNAVYFLQNIFLTDWSFTGGAALSDPRYYPEQSGESGNHYLQIVPNGPDEDWNKILQVYFATISTAEQRIFITTPYFIPDASLRMALKTAANSGVDVKIIFPKVADSYLVQWASLSYLEELMEAGVSFYQYVKGFIHTKVLLIDDTLAFAGTANLDMRSFFVNFEFNAVLFDKDIMNKLDEDFHQDLQDSQPLLLEEFQKRSRVEKLKEVVARLLSPLL